MLKNFLRCSLLVLDGTQTVRAFRLNFLLFQRLIVNLMCGSLDANFNIVICCIHFVRISFSIAAAEIHVLLELELHYLANVVEVLVLQGGHFDYLLIFSLSVVGEPVLYLFFVQAGLVSQLFFRLLIKIWMLNVCQEPLLQNPGGSFV